MATKFINKSKFVVLFAIFDLIHLSTALNQRYIVAVQTISSCKSANTDTTHQFFDISTLKCTDCTQNSKIQTRSADGLSCVCQPGYIYCNEMLSLASGLSCVCQPGYIYCNEMISLASGLSCVCQPGYKLTQDFGAGNKITCAACPNNQSFVSADGWGCMTCRTGSASQRCTADCPGNQLQVERNLDGSVLTNAAGNPERKCESCVATTKPNSDKTRCVRCSQLLSMIPTSATCECTSPSRLTGGLCFPETAYLPTEGTSLYKITSQDGSLTVESAYFKDNLRAAVGICNPALYGNLTACQMVGNLCTLLYGTQENVNRGGSGDACSQYEALKNEVKSVTDWPANMPWLFFSEQPLAQVTLEDTGIPTEYTFGTNPSTSYLNFRLASYSLNGTFKGMRNATDGNLQLCKNSIKEMQAAFQFGTIYSSSCALDADDLWGRSEDDLVFYDMYLEFTEASGINSLFPIPVNVWNLKSSAGAFVNQEASSQNWILSRRFFLVDNISTRKRVTSTDSSGNTVETLSRSELLRYASSFKIFVELQPNQRNGKIYPPYVEIRYSELKSDSYGTGQTVQVSFEVIYKSSQAKFEYDLSIAMGVLCCLGAIYAFMRTWGWSRRSGKATVDFLTTVKTLMHACGAIANVFFLVTFGAAFWFIIFYKRQNIVYLFVPTRDQEVSFEVYLSVAFGLKCLEMMHLFACQCTIDIFFIDWERPKGRVIQKQEEGGDKKKTEENPVSIWRTYMVANEWNEIQTIRKIHPLFQLFCVIFFLKVVGFENLATADPFSNFTIDSGTYTSPHSRIFRYAIAVSVYVLTGVVQYAFFAFFYERFIEDKVQQYVDLCSVSNVSVFIMANSQYGYYIHGRSVHGTADTGMKEMYEALQREEADLCGHRGLLANNDQQTFEMALPNRLRAYYDKALMPVAEINAAGSAASKMEKGQPGSPNAAISKSMQAYKNVTKFLSAFIDHSLKDIDYLVKDKVLMENILDVEFDDCSEKGAFYNDNGHSFDAILFYGNEPTLLVFDILLFCIVDLIAMDYILAAIITFLFDEILCLIRDNLGRRNLAKKTLIDQRFLI
ncbi:meckelin-like isoform X2 [Lineus longissimus]|uniref:meckelin-like isoform X2 n=1 Tax=Lineus longissimus TaxID=88925 RepID=UPI002B4C9747